MQRLSNALGDRPFFQNVWRIGMPVAIQNLLSSGLALIDNMMIGSQGEVALAAVGMAGQWGSLLFSAYWGLCCGGTLFFAQYWGAQDRRGIERAFGVMTLCMGFVSLLFATMAGVFPHAVLAFYTNDVAVQAEGARYIRIMALGYLFQTLCMACSSLLRSTENVKLPLVASLAAIATNTLLNWVLIYGNLGFPALGVQGAAMATVAAAVVNLAILLAASWRQRNILAIPLREMFPFQASFVREFFVKSAPIIANEMFYGLAMMVINMVMGRQGAANLSALTIFRTLEGLIFAFFQGFSNASSVMVGKSVGAGELEEGLRDAKRFARLCPMFSFVVCLAVLALNRPILNLFNVSGAVRATVTGMLMIYVLTAPMRTGNYIQVNIFRAGGESRMGMFLEVGGIWLIGVPLTVLAGLALRLPFLAVFAMLYVEDVVKIVLEPLYLTSGRWLKPVTPQGQAALAAFWARRKRRPKQAASL